MQDSIINSLFQVLLLFCPLVRRRLSRWPESTSWYATDAALRLAVTWRFRLGVPCNRLVVTSNLKQWTWNLKVWVHCDWQLSSKGDWNFWNPLSLRGSQSWFPGPPSTHWHDHGIECQWLLAWVKVRQWLLAWVHPWLRPGAESRSPAGTHWQAATSLTSANRWTQVPL